MDIDIHIEVPSVKYKERRAPPSSEDSASLRARMIAAKNRQTERGKGEKKTYGNAAGSKADSQTLRNFGGRREAVGKRGRRGAIFRHARTTAIRG